MRVVPKKEDFIRPDHVFRHGSGRGEEYNDYCEVLNKSTFINIVRILKSFDEMAAAKTAGTNWHLPFGPRLGLMGGAPGFHSCI